MILTIIRFFSLPPHPCPYFHFKINTPCAYHRAPRFCQDLFQPRNLSISTALRIIKAFPLSKKLPECSRTHLWLYHHPPSSQSILLLHNWDSRTKSLSRMVATTIRLRLFVRLPLGRLHLEPFLPWEPPRAPWILLLPWMSSEMFPRVQFHQA